MSQPPNTRSSSEASGTKSWIFGTRRSVRFPNRIVPSWVREPTGWAIFFIPQRLCPLGPARAKIVAIHSCNHFEFDFFGTYRFTFSNIRAAPEQFSLHCRQHLQYA